MDSTKSAAYNGLTKPRHEIELHGLVVYTMNKWGIYTYKDFAAYFKPGTDTMVDFFLRLESNTKWFNFSQAEQVKVEIALYLEQLID